MMGPEKLSRKVDERTVGDYLGAVASAAPAPGGGSVSATVGAFASALAAMVCELTIAGKAEESVKQQLREQRDTAKMHRSALLLLAAQDEHAFNAYTEAAGLPRSTEGEQRARHAALQAALRSAADVPLLTATRCLEVLQTLPAIAEGGTRHALSDIGTAALLAQSACDAALLSVRANTDLMKDEAIVASYVRRAEEISARASDAARSTREAIAGRSGHPSG